MLSFDLDNAVTMFGEWVEDKCQARVDAYVERVQRRNERNANRKGYKQKRPSKRRMQELWEEAFYYYVHGQVRRIVAVAVRTPDGGMTRKGRVALVKEATYGPEDRTNRNMRRIRLN